MGFYSFFYIIKKILKRIPLKILIFIIIFLLLIIIKNNCFAVDTDSYLCFTDVNHKYWQLKKDSNAPSGTTGGKYDNIWSDTNQYNPNYFVFLQSNGKIMFWELSGFNTWGYDSNTDVFGFSTGNSNNISIRRRWYDPANQTWNTDTFTMPGFVQMGMSDGGRTFLFGSRDFFAYTKDNSNSFTSNVSIRYTYAHPYVLNYNNQWDFNQLGISTASDLPIIGSGSHFWYDNNILFTVNGQLVYTMNVTSLMTEHQNYYYPCYYIWINKQDILDHVSFQDGDTFRMYLNTNMYSQDVTGVITDNYLLLDTVIDFDNSGNGGSSGSFDDTEILNAIGGLNQSVNTGLSNVTNAVNNLDSSVQDVNDSVQDVNQSVQDLNDTMTDDTLTVGASDLPTNNTTDITQNGLDNIFTSMYNAFCEGEAQDIVFPFPYTNKNITISATYTKDMLTNNGSNWVYLFIQTFWGYIIGRFIIKDISKKFAKIKTGDIEEIETTNIKEDML